MRLAAWALPLALVCSVGCQEPAGIVSLDGGDGDAAALGEGGAPRDLRGPGPDRALADSALDEGEPSDLTMDLSGAVEDGGGGGSDGGADGPQPDLADPCGPGCGPVELCDPGHLGLDDDCDGEVDEIRPCIPGQVHFCFKGDPRYRGTAGCFDGTERCRESGGSAKYSPCTGGVHAVAPDNCQQNNVADCHAIFAAPFATASLRVGTGAFSANAVPGTETFAVTCPQGVMPCPSVMGVDNYKALQSGEYSVRYQKLIPGNPAPQVCTFPLFIGAPGLRVELSWEHHLDDTGVDLDLHMHQPADVTPWPFDPEPAGPVDCGFANCIYYSFMPPADPASPDWFANPPAVPPTPVNWYLDPVMQQNTCYYAPVGVGVEWQALGMGCHNPRLDLDNIACDYGVTDPDDASFCAPENINVDFPPTKQWTRIAVHYYSNGDQTYDVHPEVRIYCNGALAAQLGPDGYYQPTARVTFAPGDGLSDEARRVWMVADVAFTRGPCGQADCVVQPLYADPALRTPVLTTDLEAALRFEPPYPPPP